MEKQYTESDIGCYRSENAEFGPEWSFDGGRTFLFVTPKGLTIRDNDTSKTWVVSGIEFGSFIVDLSLYLEVDVSEAREAFRQVIGYCPTFRNGQQVLPDHQEKRTWIPDGCVYSFQTDLPEQDPDWSVMFLGLSGVIKRDNWASSSHDVILARLAEIHKGQVQVTWLTDFIGEVRLG